MPPDSDFPGVPIVEAKGGPPPIVGVPTSVTAFLGRTPLGPVDQPTLVQSLSEFTLAFGALTTDCPLGCAVSLFFANGGTHALIVRLDKGGQAIEEATLIDPARKSDRRGLWALDRAGRVNLIVIPPLAPGVDVPVAVWNGAIEYAQARRAFVLVDPPSSWLSAQDALSGVDGYVSRDSRAAMYFPSLLVGSSAGGTTGMTFPPGAAVAGVYARTDATLGVWHVAAGSGAQLRGSTGLSGHLTNNELGALNGKALNGIRELLGHMPEVWGARTLAGADGMGSEWKYVNVRRLMDYVEVSVEEGTRWVVSEPNDERLWAKVQAQVEAFLLNLWRQGAMQGVSASKAYYVRCDRTTMTQDDIDNGRLVMEIGIAAVKPAEFVVVRIGQWVK